MFHLYQDEPYRFSFNPAIKFDQEIVSIAMQISLVQLWMIVHWQL